MKETQGDLLDLARKGMFDVIVHGCNCFCTMGGGIALAIRNNFPEALAADRATKKGDQTKLGTVSHATIVDSGHSITIVNAYTQYQYRGNGPHTDYQVLRLCFQTIKKNWSGKRIGFPKIGAGLGGGDWPTIAAIIDEELSGEDFTVVNFRSS